MQDGQVGTHNDREFYESKGQDDDIVGFIDMGDAHTTIVQSEPQASDATTIS